MTGGPFASSLLAVSEQVRHRLTSTLVDGFAEWWQMPLLVGLVGLLVVFVLWVYRRDAVELPRGVGLLLAALRLGAIAAVVAAYLDLEQTAEHEIVYPSRVAVLVDSSASMTLADDTEAAAQAVETRSQQALAVLDAGGLLAALAPRHEVSIWRFDADAERLVTLPLTSTADASGMTAGGEAAGADTPWREQLTPQGYETRLGEALLRVLDQEPPGVLAGIVVLSDGANNAGIDPTAAAAAIAKADVPIHPLGIGSDTLPANVRVADLLVPSRVFPGDRFAVTAYLQSQGLAGKTVKVELLEAGGDDKVKPVAGRGGRTIDVAECVLAADGELVAVRFDVPGLPNAGRHALIVRVVPPAADHAAGDDAQSADIEVVERVTEVLLMAGGPGREYQFMRNVLERDKSFTVDVLLGTAAPGISQDARRILDAFPENDEALARYDAIVALDYDWRLLDAAAQSRIERWVSRESGGLVLAAGSVFLESWLSDPQTKAIRALFPIEMRRANQPEFDAATAAREPMPLSFTRDGNDAEFLWLASSRVASQTVWSGFPGVFSCFDATEPKPGATVYARADRPGTTGDSRPIYLCGQLYGAGNILYVGSGELWRLRSMDDAVYERLVAQIVRHVSQGRLLRGSRRARLLVDRDRFPVGASIILRVVEAAAGGTTPGTLKAVGPDGTSLSLPLREEPARPGVLQAGFIASQAGTWEIAYTPAGGEDGVSRRIQVQLPDRELARPRLDRGVLEQLALGTGAALRMVPAGGWTAADSRALADAVPDRSRRDYETGAPDTAFKRRLNGILLTLGVGMLCLEWIIRRLARLA